MRAYVAVLLVVTGCLSADDGIDEDGGGDAPTGEVDQEATTTPALALARTYVTDGNVRAAVLDGNLIYLGGAFHYVGQRSGEVALVSASSGTRSTFAAIGGGSVNAIVADGHGGYFFGGDFRKVGSMNTRALAHLRSDGTWDPAWKFQITGAVRTLARDGSRLYVGGSFAAVNGQQRSNVAVIDLATGALQSPAPRIGGPVSALALAGTHLFVGIDGSDGAEPGGGVVRLELPSLSTSSWNPGGFDGPVMTLVAYGTGLYVGGGFTHVGSLARGHVASIDQSTAAVRPYNPNTDQTVYAMQRVGSVLYLGGRFATVGGTSRPRVAAVDASTGAVLAFRADTTGLGTAMAVFATSTAVYVGGQVESFSNLAYAFAFDPATGARLSWAPHPNGPIAAIAAHPSGILLGGWFTSVNGSSRTNLAAIDISTGKATSWAPATDDDPNSLVLAMALRGSTIYVGGVFSELGGQPRANVGAISTSGGVLAFRADSDDNVNALATIGSTVFLGGRFTLVAGSARDQLAAVDASSGALRSWNPGFGGEVLALQPVGSTLYAGGFGKRLGAFDASTGAARPVPTAGEVDALAYDGVHVFVGGFYTSIGGVARNSLAAIVPNTTTVTSWNPALQPYRRIAALGVSGSYVYGEDFGTIRTLSKSSGALQSFSPRVLNGRINGILPLSDRLLLVGGFHDIDYIAQENVAEYMGTP